MLGEALAYPRQGDDWLGTIVVGGVLFVFSFLVVPGIILNGYFVRVLRSAARGEETPPEFEDWEGLLMDGLKFTVVAIVYVMVPTIVLVAGIVLFGVSSGIVSLIGGLLALLGGVLVLLAAFTLPVAQTTFALDGRVEAAFELRRILGAAFTGRYLVAVVLAVVVGGLFNMIAAILSLLLVGPFVLFYAQVFVFHLQGAGCGPQLREARPSGAVAD